MVQTGSGRGPRVLGITGPIGCGKTTVGDILLELGALERIDADREVHALMQPGTEVTREIARRFGEAVIAPDGSVDRARLGGIVFADPERLRELESITHPAVRRSIRGRLQDYADEDGVVVVDAVKLLQSDLLPFVEAVWVVQCSQQVQLERLRMIRGMSREAALDRVRAQPDFRHERVTAVLENSGSLQELRERVQQAWQVFKNGVL